MKTAYLFDVDGTLTPSRRQIDPDFSKFFFDFVCTHDVYLVTGSDYPKTVEQIGNSLCCMVKRVYGCSGNDVYKKGINVYTSDWIIPAEPFDWLNAKLKASEFPLRTGNHFENRPGMLNFSVVGRNATMGERKLYVEWDERTNERNDIVDEFNALYGDTITATAGGETGLDIYPTGKDKSQIIDDFSEYDKIFFFGDRCDPQGNDYTLARAVSALSGQGKYYNVEGWVHTWHILEEIT